MTARATLYWQSPTNMPWATRSRSSRCCFPRLHGPCTKASFTTVGCRKPPSLPWFISSDNLSCRTYRMLDRRQFIAASAAVPLVAHEAAAEPAQVLRIAMTAADLPTVTGIPNNGGEGFRFLGYPAYDGVINWDYTHTNETADAI